MNSDNGLCRNLIRIGKNFKREDCCKDGNLNTFYKEDALSRSEAWDMLIGLPVAVKCSPCHRKYNKIK